MFAHRRLVPCWHGDGGLNDICSWGWRERETEAETESNWKPNLTCNQHAIITAMRDSLCFSLIWLFFPFSSLFRHPRFPYQHGSIFKLFHFLSTAFSLKFTIKESSTSPTLYIFPFRSSYDWLSVSIHVCIKRLGSFLSVQKPSNNIRVTFQYFFPQMTFKKFINLKNLQNIFSCKTRISLRFSSFLPWRWLKLNDSSCPRDWLGRATPPERLTADR